MRLTLIQRYLAGNFIPPFILSGTFFICFLLTSQLFRLTSVVISQGGVSSDIFSLFVHIGISFVPMAVPLALLFSTIFTLNKLSEDSEIIAMRSFGITKFRLFIPFLITSLVIGGTLFFLNTELIPHSKSLFKNMVIKMTSKGVLTNIKSGQFFTDIPYVILFAENVEDNGKKLEDVFIRSDKNDEERVIFAKRGALLKEQIQKNATPTLRLILREGNIIKTDQNTGDVQKILFDEYDFPILSGGYAPGFVTKDSMRSSKNLKKTIVAREKEIDQLVKEDPKNGKIGGKVKALAKSKIEYWNRINTPIQCLIFVLLGFCLGIKKGRGRTKNMTALALVILCLYYAIFFTGVSFAKKGAISAFLVVLSPSLVIFILALFLFKKLDWAS